MADDRWLPLRHHFPSDDGDRSLCGSPISRLVDGWIGATDLSSSRLVGDGGGLITVALAAAAIFSLLQVRD